MSPGRLLKIERQDSMVGGKYLKKTAHGWELGTTNEDKIMER